MKINSVGIMCGFHSDVGSRSRIIMLRLLVFNFQKRRPLGGSSQSVNREKCTRNLVNGSPRVTYRLSKAFPPVFTSKFIFKKNTSRKQFVCFSSILNWVDDPTAVPYTSDHPNSQQVLLGNVL